MNISDGFKGANTLIAAAVIVLVIGAFFLGRKTMPAKEVVRYVHGHTIRGTVGDLQPVKEVTPLTPLMPLKRDTFWMDSVVYVAEKVDTAAIIKDYILEREYRPVIEIPKLATINLSTTVQYNRASNFDFEVIPIYKEVTKYRERAFVPFVSVSYSTFGYSGIGGGFFFKRVGFEYQYQRRIGSDNKCLDKIGHQFGVKLRF